MTEKLDSRVIKNFGPSILKVKIPDEIVKTINEYIDKIVLDKKKAQSLDAGNNLVGDVTNEFNLEQEFIKRSIDNLSKKKTKHQKKFQTRLKN